jgi:hypothetical protein
MGRESLQLYREREAMTILFPVIPGDRRRTKKSPQNYFCGDGRNITPGEPWRTGLSTLTSRAETARLIPPSSEGVAFRALTWCLLFVFYRTKDMSTHHANPRVKR